MVGRIVRNLMGNKLGYLEILSTHNCDLARSSGHLLCAVHKFKLRYAI